MEVYVSTEWDVSTGQHCGAKVLHSHSKKYLRSPECDILCVLLKLESEILQVAAGRQLVIRKIKRG